MSTVQTTPLAEGMAPGLLPDRPSVVAPAHIIDIQFAGTDVRAVARHPVRRPIPLPLLSCERAAA